MGKQRRMDYKGDIFKQISLFGGINSCYIIYIGFELEISRCLHLGELAPFVTTRWKVLQNTWRRHPTPTRRACKDLKKGQRGPGNEGEVRKGTQFVPCSLFLWLKCKALVTQGCRFLESSPLDARPRDFAHDRHSLLPKTKQGGNC